MESRLSRPPVIPIDLYVSYERGGPASSLTREALRAAQRLRGVGLHLVRRKDLDDARVVDALRRHGVDRLPALLVADETYVGLDAIRRYCAWNDRKPGEARTPSGAPSGQPTALGAGAPRLPSRPLQDTEDTEDTEDDSAAALEAFYEQEMRAGRREDEIDTWGQGPDA